MAVLLPQNNLRKTENEARRWITAEIENTIHNCIKAAIDEYRNGEAYSQLRFKHSLRTSASTIHDLIVWNIKSNFNSVPNVAFVTKRNLFLLVFGNGDIIVRFKKLNKGLKTSNIPTQQSFAFVNQLSLLEPSINLNAGYLLSESGTKIYITCPLNASHNSWVWELAITEDEKIFTLPTQEAAAPRKKREFKEKKGSLEDGKDNPVAN